MTTTTMAGESGTEGRRDALGRVRISAERRKALRAQFAVSNLSGQAFAAQAGIKYSTFAHWRQQWRREEESLAGSNATVESGQREPMAGEAATKQSGTSAETGPQSERHSASPTTGEVLEQEFAGGGEGVPADEAGKSTDWQPLPRAGQPGEGRRENPMPPVMARPREKPLQWVEVAAAVEQEAREAPSPQAPSGGLLVRGPVGVRIEIAGIGQIGLAARFLRQWLEVAPC